MMAAIDRLPDAARVLDYLATAGDFGALALRTLVAAADATVADSLAANPELRQAAARRLDSRQALEFMRDVLDELSDDQERASELVHGHDEVLGELDVGGAETRIADNRH